MLRYDSRPIFAECKQSTCLSFDNFKLVVKQYLVSKMSDNWANAWKQEIDKLASQNLLRELHLSIPQRIGKRSLIDLSSNDYLGLANDERLIEALIEGAKRWGVGARASRLIVGHSEAHRVLEERLADLKGTEAALVFPSGYQTNAGLISALVSRHDMVLADRLCHASILDGVRMSGAKLDRFRHNDLSDLEKHLLESKRRTLVVTESVFSMDGDVAPLPEILDLTVRYGALLVIDEAHATGVMGDRGSGAWGHFGLPTGPEVPVVLMGTLSKALGCQGGFVCGSRLVVDYLINRCRAFIYSTGLSPALAWAAVKALEISETDSDLRNALHANIDLFRSSLSRFISQGSSETRTAIIPVIVGDAAGCVTLSRQLEQRGILALPVRPPTVPEGSSRLRLTVTAAHRPGDLQHAAEVILGEIGKEPIEDNET